MSTLRELLERRDTETAGQSEQSRHKLRQILGELGIDPRILTDHLASVPLQRIVELSVQSDSGLRMVAEGGSR